MKIRLGIVGYGNVGRGVEKAIQNFSDMELTAVFSRRKLAGTDSNAPVVLVDDIANWQDKVDVLLLCGGSATDLKEQTPAFTKYFNTVDSFDTHAVIPEHFANVDKVAQTSGKISIISVGWDPGLFSLARVLGTNILPNGEDYTFWGPGVSQGHSDAIRRIEGVLDAKQYTLPIESAVEKVRSGENPSLTTREKHHRDCYVVVKENADCKKIEATIKAMPNYFADYDTTVTFLSQKDFDANHKKMPHGGFVFRTGKTNASNKHIIEFALKLDSNPEFTASIMVAYARAAYRLNKSGESGCKTVFDIAPATLSHMSNEELRKTML